MVKRAIRYKHPARELIERFLYRYIEEYQKANLGAYPSEKWIEAKRQYLIALAIKAEKRHNLIGGG